MLGKKTIEKEIGKGICLFPFEPKNIKENSINLSPSEYAWTMGNGNVAYNKEKLDFQYTKKSQEEGKVIKKFQKGDSAIITTLGNIKTIILLPHSTTLIQTKEVVGINNYLGGTVHSKVGLVSLGIGHIGTMLGPNFCGHLLIAIHNITDDLISLNINETFVSVALYYLTSKVEKNNPHMTGHLDKFSSLGIKLKDEERVFLSEDWKMDFNSIKTNMKDTEAYRKFISQMETESFFSTKKGKITLLALLTILFIGLLIGSYFYDRHTGKNFWFEKAISIFTTVVLVPIITFITSKISRH